MRWGWDKESDLLLWDGEPVRFRLGVISSTQHWQDYEGRDRSQVVVVFENGWDCEFRLDPELEGPASDPDRICPGQLTAMASNRRAIAEQQRREESGETGMVGDEWDFSYLKTGYENPGAYVQWPYLLDEETDETSDPDDWPSCQIVPVADPADLRRRLAQVAAMASDPAAWRDAYEIAMKIK